MRLSLSVFLSASLSVRLSVIPVYANLFLLIAQLPYGTADDITYKHFPGMEWGGWEQAKAPLRQTVQAQLYQVIGGTVWFLLT